MNGHRARKRFGQNFLHDQAVIGRIIATIAPAASDRVVEIGPGLGALTLPLSRQVHDLQLIEIDRDLVQRLRQQFPVLRIHENDVLDVDFAELGDQLRIVGNLPYNISTPLLFHLSQFVERVRDAHFMLQKEVVERMTALPGSKAFGRLSVMLQYRWQIERLFTVAAEAFQPSPKVQSAVVRLRPHMTLPWRANSESDLAEVVTAAFGQRRKTLRNALHSLLAESDITALAIDAGARAETLGVDAFVRLADKLTNKRQASA